MKMASIASYFISSAHSSASWRNLSESGCVSPVLHQALSWPPQGTERAANQASGAWTMLKSVHLTHISCHCVRWPYPEPVFPLGGQIAHLFPTRKSLVVQRIQKELWKCITTKMRNAMNQQQTVSLLLAL